MPNDAIGTEQLLPYERGDSPADARKSLFAALDSEPGFEQPEEDEPAADKAPKAHEAESEDAEADDESEEESEDESDEDAEGESDEDEGPEADPLHEVTVDGQPQKITLKEALAGYQRQADYTRGKVALAREKETVQAEVTQTRAVRDQLAQRLESLALTIKQTQPAEPDWARLKAENPTEYVVQREAWRSQKEKLAEIEAEQRKVYEERLADFQKQQEASLEEERAKLHEAIPEWKDAAKQQAEKTKLAEYLTGTYGWTMADLAQVTDHRLMVALRKSMLYDEGQTKGKEKIAGKVKPATAPLKPGARERAPQRGIKVERKRAREALARSGRTEHAARFLETLLDD